MLRIHSDLRMFFIQPQHSLEAGITLVEFTQIVMNHWYHCDEQTGWPAAGGWDGWADPQRQVTGSVRVQLHQGALTPVTVLAGDRPHHGPDGLTSLHHAGVQLQRLSHPPPQPRPQPDILTRTTPGVTLQRHASWNINQSWLIVKMFFFLFSYFMLHIVENNPVQFLDMIFCPNEYLSFLFIMGRK